jgi:hypothetical protein
MRQMILQNFMQIDRFLLFGNFIITYCDILGRLPAAVEFCTSYASRSQSSGEAGVFARRKTGRSTLTINNQQISRYRLESTRFLRRWRSILILAALPLFADYAAAATPFDNFPSLMDTLMGGNYQAADSICAKIAFDNSEHPAALYAESVVLYSRMIDSEDSTGRGRYLALADSCIILCDKWYKVDANSAAWPAYLKGSALSSQGILLIRGGERLAGLRKLLSAKREFDAAIEADSLLYDAYLGRGMYRCAVVQNASILGGLPFMPDLQSGLADLRLAADSAHWSRWAALNALAWFELEEGNYSFVDSVCRLGLARFPESRAFLWPLLAMHVRQNQWQQTDETASRLLNLYLAASDNNGYEATTLYWRRMVCADSLGRAEDAVNFAKAGLAVPRTADVEQRRREKVEAMQKRLERAGDRER